MAQPATIAAATTQLSAQDDASLPDDPATLLADSGQSDQEKAQKFPDPNVPPTRQQARVRTELLEQLERLLDAVSPLVLERCWNLRGELR